MPFLEQRLHLTLLNLRQESSSDGAFGQQRVFSGLAESSDLGDDLAGDFDAVFCGAAVFPFFGNAPGRKACSSKML